MRANLAERERLYGGLFPWDHPNYGMDEAWVRCHPYQQQARPGTEVQLRVVVTNHSSQVRKAECRAVLPHAWQREDSGKARVGGTGVSPVSPANTGKMPVPPADQWSSTEIPAKQEGFVRLSFGVPADAQPGRYVVPVDLRYHDRVLPQFTEAIVVVD
jgi:hypothetical protein